MTQYRLLLTRRKYITLKIIFLTILSSIKKTYKGKTLEFRPEQEINIRNSEQDGKAELLFEHSASLLFFQI